MHETLFSTTGEHIICFDYEIVQHKAVTIEDYSSLFATIRHYSPLFALFVLFAIRDYSLFAIRVFQTPLCKWHFDIDWYKFEKRWADVFQIYPNSIHFNPLQFVPSMWKGYFHSMAFQSFLSTESHDFVLSCEYKRGGGRELSVESRQINM